MLIGLCGERPEARERLSLILRRSPERFRVLIERAKDDAALRDLALLLPRLGRWPAVAERLAGGRHDFRGNPERIRPDG